MNQSFEKVATKVSMISLLGNFLLSAMKLIAGTISHSEAMMSDAIHSGSDVIYTIIVMIGAKLSSRESDDTHPYGHERFECVVAFILSFFLLITSFLMAKEAMNKMTHPSTLVVPRIIALVASVITILTKELLYRYTTHYAILYDSGALKASAWDHRSDALASIGAFIGIFGARLGYPILDSVASLVICGFILKTAYEVFMDAMNKMVDHACDKETEQAIYICALKIDGIVKIDMLQTRIFGSRIYVDIEIQADKNLRLSQSHKIAENVHDEIEKNFPKVKHIMVHVNPND